MADAGHLLTTDPMLRRVLQRLRSGAAPALATAYLREERIFVPASDRTVWRTAGFWANAGPVECIAVSDPPELLGRTVLAALARSLIEVPVPTDLKTVEAQLFRAMGVRSRRASMQGTRCCMIEREQRSLKVEPYHNGGASLVKAATTGRSERPNRCVSRWIQHPRLSEMPSWLP